jgi:YfiH family protein
MIILKVEHLVERIENGPTTPVYYQFEMWQHSPLRHGIFTRHGGVSKGPWASLNVGGTVGDETASVAENHRRMYASLDLQPEQACTVWQVHGTDTVIVNGPMPQRKWLTRADAMITNRPGIALAMRFADCTPILLYDPEHHAIGLTHAGWRGTVQGVARRAVEAMKNTYGSDPTNVQAAIGPSIGPDRYQVGEEVVDAVQEQFDTTDYLIQRATDGSAYLNLWAANELALRSVGVRHVEQADLCTATHTDEFFSHRAEHGNTGRFGVVMVLSERL